jgi:hypothetical protein
MGHSMYSKSGLLIYNDSFTEIPPLIPQAIDRNYLQPRLGVLFLLIHHIFNNSTLKINTSTANLSGTWPRRDDWMTS